jgi:parallel beta-helix repeat protein
MSSVPNPAPNYCINIVASGTAYSGVSLTSGGNNAAANGYMTWRCTTLDGCTITPNAGTNGAAGFYCVGTDKCNYTIIDGFVITAGAQTTYGQGIEIVDDDNVTQGTFGSHHTWVFNSIISGNGQSGIQFGAGDYSYVIHNTLVNNSAAASCDNGAQGSGFSDVIPYNIEFGHSGYVATADDKVNPNALIGSFTVGTDWFHKVTTFNVVNRNRMAGCTSGDETDGNDIIQDTFYFGNTPQYTHQSLIAFNIVNNSGGGGIHITGGENTTVQNNTCYNVYLGTNNTGTGRGCIDANPGYAMTFLGNIAIQIAAASGIMTYNSPWVDGGGFTNSGGFGTVTTTLSAAITTTSQSTASVSGHANILAGANGTFLVQIDSEVMQVTAGGGTNSWSGIVRGVDGTSAATHSNGATVTWVPNYWANNISLMAGSNSATNGEASINNGAVFAASLNKLATDPKLVNVGGTGYVASPGNETTQPTGANFALQSGSPAIGYGLSEGYLPAQSVDAGACHHSLSTCP